MYITVNTLYLLHIGSCSCIHVGIVLEQESHYIQVTMLTGPHQWCPQLLIWCELCSFNGQNKHSLQILTFSGSRESTSTPIFRILSTEFKLPSLAEFTYYNGTVIEGDHTDFSPISYAIHIGFYPLIFSHQLVTKLGLDHIEDFRVALLFSFIKDTRSTLKNVKNSASTYRNSSCW